MDRPGTLPLPRLMGQKNRSNLWQEPSGPTRRIMETPSTSGPSAQKAIRRASCDQCRKKKAKCDGAKPSCRRCTRTNAECIYSMQKPIGRPLRRRLILPLTPSSSSSSPQCDIAPALGRTHVLPISSPPSVMETLNRLDLETFLRLPPITGMDYEPRSGEDADYTNKTTNGIPDAHVIPNAMACHPTISDMSSSATTQPLDSLTPSPSCACLANFYLTLDQLRENEQLSFPSGLRFLRNIIATATQMAHCKNCPTRYLSAMQNVQLLGTLITSIAKQYGAILESIDIEARLSEQSNKPKLLHFGEVGLGLRGRSSLDTESDYAIEASASEWRALANKAVKSEVYGSKSNSDSFWALLDFLEERQTMWHTIPPSPDYPRMYLFEKEPLCIKLIHEARRLLGALKFHDIDDRLSDPGE